MENEKFSIAGHLIGPGQPALMVAEIGGNHGGDSRLAAAMVRAAAEAGAHAVKFQAYRAAAFLSRLNPYYEELAAEELTFTALHDLSALAKSLGLAVGLTVFDEEGLELAAGCGADYLKISSGDLTNTPLLEQAAKAGPPVVVSTGAAYEDEVRSALKSLLSARNRLILLQCSSLYPAPPETVNLAVMRRWLDEGLSAGYSDHVQGLSAAKMALALGAIMLEKHFTTDPELPGGDNSMSMNPAELRELMRWSAGPEKGRSAKKDDSVLEVDGWGINNDFELLWGQPEKKPHQLEVPVRPLIRRAVVAARSLPAGKILAAEDLLLRRPPLTDDLIGPDQLTSLPGRVLARGLSEGEPLGRGDLADG